MWTGPFPSIGRPRASTTPAHHLLARRHLKDLPGALDLVSFFDERGIAEEHESDRFLFQVESDAEDFVRKLHQLSVHDALEPMGFGDAVAGGDDRPDFRNVDVRFVVANLLLQDLRDFIRPDVHRLLSSSARRSETRQRFFFEAAELCGDARVEDPVPDAHHDSA